jgi:hypothetical protein
MTRPAREWFYFNARLPLQRRWAPRVWSRSVLREFSSRPPVTLNEKIRFRMAADRRQILTTFADKWAVRAYVADRIGAEFLTDVYAVVRRPRDLNLSTLPRRCVIKATHGSGATILIDDRAPRGVEIPSPRRGNPWGVGIRIHPDDVDRKAFDRLCRAWLRSDYSRVWGLDEWPYRKVPPRLIVEELLDDGTGASPPDYRLWCFNGQVAFVQVGVLLRDHRRTLLHPDDSNLHVPIFYSNAVSAPDTTIFPQLLHLAERLAAEIDFLRVDLYVIGNRIVFGELTNYPGGGGAQMDPEQVFADLAGKWVPQRHPR